MVIDRGMLVCLLTLDAKGIGGRKASLEFIVVSVLDVARGFQRVIVKDLVLEGDRFMLVFVRVKIVVWVGNDREWSNMIVNATWRSTFG